MAADEPAAASDGPGISPFDTVLSSSTRFIIEVVAWIAGPCATGEVLGSPWWAVPALIVLVALPAVFNTPGDKHTTGIATPGPIRIAIEMLLLVVAIVAAWIVWPEWLAVLVTLVGVMLLRSGVARYRWLANGAPAVLS